MLHKRHSIELRRGDGPISQQVRTEPVFRHIVEMWSTSAPTYASPQGEIVEFQTSSGETFREAVDGPCWTPTLIDAEVTWDDGCNADRRVLNEVNRALRQELGEAFRKHVLVSVGLARFVRQVRDALPLLGDEVVLRIVKEQIVERVMTE